MKNMGLLLHIGNGEVPRGFTSMKHDPEKFPWPYKTNSVHICLAPHCIEHIKPWLVYKFFNELWRIIKKDGQLAISAPYAGSAAFWGDPSHCTGINERTFKYLDPEHEVYNKATTKPWKMEKGNPVYQLNGNIECVMRPMK